MVQKLAVECKGVCLLTWWIPMRGRSDRDNSDGGGHGGSFDAVVTTSTAAAASAPRAKAVATAETCAAGEFAL